MIRFLDLQVVKGYLRRALILNLTFTLTINHHDSKHRLPTSTTQRQASTQA
jgi:hypothetical protein